MFLQKVLQLLFLCLNYRIEVKQRNFDDLMYDLQSLKEKNERLKDRVRDIWTTSTISYKYLKVQFFIFFINKEKKTVDQFIMLNLINLQSFVRIWQCKCMEIWDAKFANCYKEMYTRGASGPPPPGTWHFAIIFLGEGGRLTMFGGLTCTNLCLCFPVAS